MPLLLHRLALCDLGLTANCKSVVCSQVCIILTDMHAWLLHINTNLAHIIAVFYNIKVSVLGIVIGP